MAFVQCRLPRPSLARKTPLVDLNNLDQNCNAEEVTESFSCSGFLRANPQNRWFIV